MDYNARFYSPTIRRFISADSLIPDPSSSQAFNRYSYVTGNPIMLDATGEAVGFAESRTRVDLEKNQKLVLSLVKMV